MTGRRRVGLDIGS